MLSAAVFFTAALSFAQTEPSENTQPSEVTLDDCEGFGKRLAEYLDTGKQEAVFDEMDQIGYIARSLEGFEITPVKRQEFEQAYLKKLIGKLTEEFREFNHARYLRTQVETGEKRVLIRLTAKNHATSYVSFRVIKTPDKHVRWIDLFGYANGESICDASRRYLFTLTQGRLSKPRNLAEAAVFSNGQHFMQRLTAAEKLFNKGQFETALKSISQLPDELRNARFVFAIRLRAAQSISDEEQLKTIEAWEEAYPGDPSLNLISLDAHIIRKNYPEAVRCIDALAIQLKGTDGRLCYLKAYILDKDKMPSAARAAAEEGIATEPDMTDNYTALLKFALDERDFAAAVRVLMLVEKNMPDTDPKRLIPEFEAPEEFFKSSEFTSWFKKRLPDGAR